ncbi:MAG: hypothetical protein ACI9S8_002968 [Chlamydiales bacterium]|jgi:hypothetical protein
MTLNIHLDTHYREFQDIHRYVGLEESRVALGERTLIVDQEAARILSTLYAKKASFYSLYHPLLIIQCDQLIDRVQYLIQKPPVNINLRSSVEAEAPLSPVSLASTIPIFPHSPLSSMAPSPREIPTGHYNFVVQTSQEIDVGTPLADSGGKVQRLMKAAQFFFQSGYTLLANFCMKLIRKISWIFQQSVFHDDPSVSVSTPNVASPTPNLSIHSENSFINKAITTMLSHEKSRHLLESVSHTYKGIGGLEVVINPDALSASWRTPFDTKSSGKVLARQARISVSPKILENEGELIDSLLFELIKASQEEEFSKYSLQAVKGEINREEFIKASELVEFKTIKRQRDISSSLAKNGVPVKDCSNPFRDEDHFWSWTLESNSAHAEAHGMRFDQLKRHAEGQIGRLV